jgi:hypothetical protein
MAQRSKTPVRSAKISLEATRTSSQFLVDAYEQLVPTTCRALNVARTPPALRPADNLRSRAGRGGYDAPD